MPPPSSLLLYDLETIPDAELGPYVPADANQGDFPPPPYHQIVSIASMALDTDYRVADVAVSTASYEVVTHKRCQKELLCTRCSFTRHQCMLRLDHDGACSHDPPPPSPTLTIDPRAEIHLLQCFLDLYTPTTALVTWNGRRFDNPVLVARCFRHGIPIPHYYAPRGARYRYSTQGHYDVADQLADQGAGRMWRLGDAARLIGWPGKGETTGADVASLVSQGRMQEVRDYNLEDVAQLAACFYRAELIRGGIELAEYRDLAAGLLAFCDQHETLHTLSARVQRARFTLS